LGSGPKLKPNGQGICTNLKKKKKEAVECKVFKPGIVIDFARGWSNGFFSGYLN